MADQNRFCLENCLSRSFSFVRDNIAYAFSVHESPTPVSPASELDFKGDPTSWKDVLRLPPSAQKRYKDATVKELQGLKDSKCIRLVPRSSIPHNETIYQSSVMWTTKFRNGVYDKTKCRCCLAGNTFDKSLADCFAPTVRFASVLILVCLSAMFGWSATGLDYTMAYHAKLDAPCYMRAPLCMREFDANG